MRTVILFSILMTLGMVAYAQEKNFIDQPYIEVNGHADTLVMPDEIHILILLSEKDTRDRMSVEELEQKMVSLFKGMGIDTEKDLSLTDMASNFRFYMLKDKDVIKTKSYDLKVGDAGLASRVFERLESIGISNALIGRVEFSRAESVRDIMRARAAGAAKAHAMAYASAVGQAVGPALHISEAADLDKMLSGKVPGIQIRGMSKMSGVVPEMPRIDFEKIKIEVNVIARFVLK